MSRLAGVVSAILKNQRSAVNVNGARIAGFAQLARTGPLSRRPHEAFVEDRFCIFCPVLCPVGENLFER